MKRLGNVMLFSLVFLVAQIVGASAAEKQILRMNSQFTAMAALSKIDQWFADEVFRATNGAVKIDVFWVGSLAGPKENLTLLRTGAIDLAVMSASYFPADLPLFSAPNELPMAFDNLRQVRVLMPRLLKEVPGFEQEAARNGFRPLFFHLLNPYLLVSRSPILGLADLKGKKIRTWGEDLPTLFKTAGATPVNMVLTELYENLHHGVVDAIPFSTDLTVAYKIYEVAKHVSEVNVWLGPSAGVWINEAKWRQISPENRKIILDVATRARTREFDAMTKAESEARSTLKKMGVSFHPFPAEDLTRWKAASPDFYAAFVARMEKLGKGSDARKSVEIMKKVRADFP